MGRGMAWPGGPRLKGRVRRVRVLLALAVAPAYLYYCVAVRSFCAVLVTGSFAMFLLMSQYLEAKSPHESWKNFLTPVAGCLLNASVICTTGFQRSPFLFTILIPLLTYGTERDGKWVFNSVMLNTGLMVFLAVKALAEADWFGLLNVLGLTGLSHIACSHIRRSKGLFASAVACALHEGRKDPLTGLYNRRMLHDKVAELMASGRPFALVLCDVDQFKKFQDKHGHLEGDRFLRRIARVLLHAVVPGGMAFRWGGDEFVLILPAAESAKVQEICSGICESVTVEAPDLSMSFGVAVFPGDGTSLEELLRTADRRLYQAKCRMSDLAPSGIRGT